LLNEIGSRLLGKLTIRQRPGKLTFRYWQEGAGYDRNFDNEKSVRAVIDYIHLNPVRRGLCQRVLDWKWSSALYFAEPEQMRDPDLPTIHGLPPEFFTDADPD
jgi:putative transposase